MSRVIFRLFNKLVAALSAPVILSEYFRPETGKEYGIGFFTKLRLAVRMRQNRKRISTASHFLEHLLMATEIMKVPIEVEGCVVECGSFKGGSAANLSLVCALCKRELEIFDSFAGLPVPSEIDQRHLLVGTQEVHTYMKGAFCGALDEVQKNISQCGNLDVCHFNMGYFDQTLPGFQKACILAFLDVDLVDSLETCLKYLWPLLQDGCYLFTHEAHHMEIPACFFSENWWRANLHCGAPGLIGAGSGIGLQPSSGGFRSALGYTVKNPKIGRFDINHQTGNIGK
ncbi:MAG TPA: TylF/MycF/NovP-related O-methyltransferase [Candidatus Angelobacter sp.]|nr:TylF/MycF/NovP-related O-methyltransferase [Candidatus Angelobacter sp.]